MKPRKQRLIAENRKARHDYHIEETFEAGLALMGSEVKSLRAGKANLMDGYAVVENGEVFLRNVHISPYEQAGEMGHEPMRIRKLLLHKSEILKIRMKVREKRYTLVPLRLYFNPAGRAKVELALARGKREYDKRQDIQEREARRKIARALKDNMGAK